ncbi:hypothetical protein FRC17_010455 [Serendipita sp. 399]|nr:hypothetical protein FRC17_010455 [Serendipita sp. 399]
MEPRRRHQREQKEEQKSFTQSFDRSYMPKDPWASYNAITQDADEEFLDDCNESMDSLLVFAGLFSAVTTALIVETYKTLKVEPESRTEHLLELILQKLGNLSAPDQIQDIPQTRSTPPRQAILANGLLFLSLTLSLIAALTALLIKQWTRRIFRGLRSITSGRDRAREHFFRMEGVKRWSLTNLIAAVPMILHLALLAFFVGLLLWLVPLNHTVWLIVLVLCLLWLLAYLATACIPCIWHDAPYVWPTSILLEKAFKNVKIVSSHIFDLNTVLIRLRTQAKPALPTSLLLVIQSQDIQLPTEPEARILVTYIDRNKTSAYDNLVTPPDNLDIQILLSLMKDSRSSLPLEAMLELIYHKIQNDQTFQEPESVVEGEMLTEIINRASQSALACRSSINGYLEITPGVSLDRVTIAMQFFDAAIQTIDFERDNRKSCFQPLLGMVDLLMERALHIRSLDELVLYATSSIRLQLKLGLFYHLDRALEIIEAIRALSPVPDLKRGPRGLGWPPEQIAKWQMVVSPYLHSLTLMILQAFPPQSTSQGSKSTGTALEETRDMIPGKTHSPPIAPLTIQSRRYPLPKTHAPYKCCYALRMPSWKALKFR